MVLTTAITVGGQSLGSQLTHVAFSHVLPGGNGLVFKLSRDAALKPIQVVVALVESDPSSQSTKLVDRPGIARLIDTRSGSNFPPLPVLSPFSLHFPFLRLHIFPPYLFLLF